MKRFLFIGSFLISCQIGLTQNLDYRILTLVNIDRNTSLDPGMVFLSASATTFSLVGPSTALGLGLIRKQKPAIRKGLFAMETLAVNAAMTYAGKYVFDRDRPFQSHPDIVKLSPGGSPSFPSGHTSLAFASATAMTMAFPKWYVALPSYGWATLVGYSRMHTGVHYPSDVLVGALVGMASAYVSQALNQQLFHTYRRPQEY